MKKVTQFYEAKSDEEIAIWLGSRLNPKLFGPGKRFPSRLTLLMRSEERRVGKECNVLV